MKRNDEFILKSIAGMTVLVPFGLKSFDVNGIIKLNETAKFFFGNLFSRISYSLLLQFLKFPLVKKLSQR